MKFSRLPLANFNLINQTIEKVKRFALIKMSELKRSLDLEGTKKIDQPPAKKLRYKNRKFALLLCYSGQDYYGLQRNEPFKTIEGELLKTLLKLEIIDKEKHDKPRVFRFQRAARTDKGVSALRQMISCNFPENFPDEIERINQALPDEIRLISAKKTVPSFDARNFCDSRTYTYTFPTFTISPPKTILSSYYRINDELIDKCNQLLSIYKGTHNFHNFTAGKSPNEQSSMRFIMDIDCSKPFLFEDMEFARITIHGQSFMLHQIRKMVGLVFAIMRGFGEEDKIQKSFLKEKQDIPIAPSLGLLLEYIHYDTYNRKYTGDGDREPLIWNDFNEQIEEFKNKFIIRNIYKQEKKTYSMMKWIDSLQLHANHMLNKATGNTDQNLVKEDNVEELTNTTQNNKDNLEAVDDDKKVNDDKVNCDKVNYDEVNYDNEKVVNTEISNKKESVNNDEEKLNKVDQSKDTEYCSTNLNGTKEVLESKI